MKFPMVSSLILFVLMSCFRADYVVESDYSYRRNFNKYKTFSFANKTMFPGSESEKAIVEKYMNNTLTAWGYDRSDCKPDLLIFYAMYYEDLNFHGFDQPQFQAWLHSTFNQSKIVFKRDTLPDGSLEEVPVVESSANSKEDYHKVRYALNEGTILTSLFDRRKKRTVWQGYASGIFGKGQRQNDKITRSAIIRIMDEYKLLAFGASGSN